MFRPRSVSRWDIEVDVLIAGSGAAGLTTAIAAYDADPSARILLVEKLPEARAGGNSRASASAIFPPADRDRLLAYQRALNEPNPVPEEVLTAWADGMMALEPWLTRLSAEVGMQYGRRTSRDMGAHRPEFPDLPGADAWAWSATIEPNPSGPWKMLRAQVARRPVELRFECALADLVQQADSGEVVGAICETPQGQLTVRVLRGVVLCTGGFENSLPMLRDFWGVDRCYPFGTPGNTGDGVRILMRAGADLWHMKNRTTTAGIWPGFKVPGHDTLVFRAFAPSGGSWLEIARDHRRFHDEATRHDFNHFKRQVHGAWTDALHALVTPIHLVFDETARHAGPIAETFIGWATVVEGCAWSEDNGREVAAGWIQQAPDLRSLAARIGRDPEALQAAVHRFNDAARAGHDPEFGRDPARMAPLETPPFYAIEIVPGVICTTGGGRRDARARVLDHAGRPIPRLYEAGELGSTMANLYQSGSFITECIVFGRIAGENVVAEPPAR